MSAPQAISCEKILVFLFCMTAMIIGGTAVALLNRHRRRVAGLHV